MLNLLMLLLVLIKVFVDAKKELEPKSVFINLDEPATVRMIHIYATPKPCRERIERSGACTQLELKLQINEWRANLRKYDKLRRRLIL